MARITELSSSAPKKGPKTESKKSKGGLAPIEDPLQFMEDCFAEVLSSVKSLTFPQVKKKREFRTSSLPFCPILDFLREPHIESYDKSHYTSTGTSIHETLQSWMSVAKIPRSWLWGSWKCTGCHEIKRNQFQPRKICGCAHTVSTTDFHRGWPKHWTYEEVDYNYHGLSGHIDGILIPRPDFAFVIDFKTTELAVKRARYNWKADKVSSPTYVAQVRTYSTILDLEFELPIRGWMLVNVERGRPIKSNKDYHVQTARWDSDKSRKWDKVLKTSIENNLILTSVEEAVDSSNRDEAKTQIKRMIKNRPCVDEKSYDAYMKYKFFQGKCEHCDVCLGGSNKAIYNRIMSELAKKE